MTDRPFFEDVEPIGYAGPGSDDPFSFRWYDPDRVVAGRTMPEHLRMPVCYWHSFVWPGSDVFGDGILDRPWAAAGIDPMVGARSKMAATFEFFEKLGLPYFTFHDRDSTRGGLAPQLPWSTRIACRRRSASRSLCDTSVSAAVLPVWKRHRFGPPSTRQTAGELTCQNQYTHSPRMRWVSMMPSASLS